MIRRLSGNFVFSTKSWTEFHFSLLCYFDNLIYIWFIFQPTIFMTAIVLYSEWLGRMDVGAPFRRCWFRKCCRVIFLDFFSSSKEALNGGKEFLPFKRNICLLNFFIKFPLLVDTLLGLRRHSWAWHICQNIKGRPSRALNIFQPAQRQLKAFTTKQKQLKLQIEPVKLR